MAIPQITPRTYRYIGSSLHVFSTLWLLVIILVICLAARPATPTVQGGSPALNHLASLVGVLLAVAFLTATAWVQATCWIERIRLSHDGIEWIGWNGRIKRRAKLAEIKSIDVEHSGKLDVMWIETMSGVIKATSHLRGFKDLAKQVNGVIESYNEGLRPLPRTD
jgi:hypothetical protein